jgi:hypothetical protein
MPFGPHQGRGRRRGAAQHERGDALIPLGVLDGQRGVGGGPAACVQGAGDVGEVGVCLAAAHDGLLSSRRHDVATRARNKHASLNRLGRYSFRASTPRDGPRPLRDPDAVESDDELEE